MSEPVVGIVMGSDSDWPMLEPAAETLAEFDVPYEVRGDDVHLVRDVELGQGLGGRLEHRPVRVAPHDDADDRVTTRVDHAAPLCSMTQCSCSNAKAGSTTPSAR